MLYIAIYIILLRPRGIPPLPTRRTLVNISSPSALSPSQQPSVIRSSSPCSSSPRLPWSFAPPSLFTAPPPSVAARAESDSDGSARSEVFSLSLSLAADRAAHWRAGAVALNLSLALSRSLARSLSLKRQAPVHAPALSLAIAIAIALSSLYLLSLRSISFFPFSRSL
jgi:hypothetical protein